MTRPADDDRFEIHGFWRTSATYRVRVAFHLKGVKPRETVVDMDGGEQNGEAFRRLNPLGGLPAVVDHAPGQPPVPLTQSLAILEFLDELYPQPPLLPADAHGRARVRSIAQMLAADTHPPITRGVISGWGSAASIRNSFEVPERCGPTTTIAGSTCSAAISGCSSK